MTEPKRWLALDRRDPRRTGLPTVEVVAAADFDRLRDERDAEADGFRDALHDAWADGWFTAETTRKPAASPDERLREALRTMIDVYDRHDRWCGHYAQAPGDGIIHRIDGARNALAAADREAHLEPAPQNDATRAQIVAAKLIADREAPDEETR